MGSEVGLPLGRRLSPLGSRRRRRSTEGRGARWDGSGPAGRTESVFVGPRGTRRPPALVKEGIGRVGTKSGCPGGPRPVNDTPRLEPVLRLGPPGLSPPDVPLLAFDGRPRRVGPVDAHGLAPSRARLGRRGRGPGGHGPPPTAHGVPSEAAGDNDTATRPTDRGRPSVRGAPAQGPDTVDVREVNREAPQADGPRARGREVGAEDDVGRVPLDLAPHGRLGPGRRDGRPPGPARGHTVAASHRLEPPRNAGGGPGDPETGRRGVTVQAGPRVPVPRTVPLEAVAAERREGRQGEETRPRRDHPAGVAPVVPGVPALPPPVAERDGETGVGVGPVAAHGDVAVVGRDHAHAVHGLRNGPTEGHAAPPVGVDDAPCGLVGDEGSSETEWVQTRVPRRLKGPGRPVGGRVAGLERVGAKRSLVPDRQGVDSRSTFRPPVARGDGRQGDPR